MPGPRARKAAVLQSAGGARMLAQSRNAGVVDLRRLYCRAGAANVGAQDRGRDVSLLVVSGSFRSHQDRLNTAIARARHAAGRWNRVPKQRQLYLALQARHARISCSPRTVRRRHRHVRSRLRLCRVPTMLSESRAADRLLGHCFFHVPACWSRRSLFRLCVS